MSSIKSFDEARKEWAKHYLTELLKITSGNVAKAAELSGRTRGDFYKLLKKYGVRKAAK